MYPSQSYSLDGGWPGKTSTQDVTKQRVQVSLILPLLHQTFLFSCPAKITDKDGKDHLYRNYKVELQCAMACIYECVLNMLVQYRVCIQL